jgi:hypothetical protein
MKPDRRKGEDIGQAARTELLSAGVEYAELLGHTMEETRDEVKNR